MAGNNEDQFENVEEDRVANAVSSIISDTISEYKDFQFPQKKIDIVYKRLYAMVSNRIKALGADTMAPEMDAVDIVQKYREHYSRSGDIQYITSSYNAMEYEVPLKAKSAVMAVADPMPGPSHAAAKEMPPMKFGKLNAKRVGSVRRNVRFQTPDKIHEIPETKEE